jgi:Trehalose utilisation
LSAAFDTGLVAENIGYNVISTAVVVALVWFREGIFLRLGAAYRWIYSVMTGKRFVLVWIDDDRNYSHKLIRRLRDQEGDELNFHAIKRPQSVLYYPLSPARTACIVLLDTDVSKLADEPETTGLIEDRLRAFVTGGGGLIGSHDLIYRRTRNEVLQSIFGCQLDQYVTHGEQPVKYRINPEHANHPLAADLPRDFELDDGEVCWGKWLPDTTAVFRTSDENSRPLVVCREYLEGRVVWLNSGDRTDCLCASIALPEEPFVTLLRNALRWVQPAA